MDEQKEKKFSSRKIEVTDEIRNMPIEDLVKYGLSEGYIPTLARMGINTLGELLKANTDEIYDATKTDIYSGYWSIRSVIMNMGLCFDDDRLKWESAGISDEIALIPIENLDLTPHLKNTLTRRGSIRYLGDLLTTDYENLIRIKLLGDDGIIELKNYIHSLGFSFPNEELTMKELKESYKAKGILMIEEALNLDGSTCGVLYRNGIYTLQDLINFGPRVFDLIGLGDVKKQKLESAMQARNIQFGTTVIVPAESPIGVRPTEKIIYRAKADNESIRKRIDNKEKLLSEYEKLMKERSDLLAREQKLDEEIASKIAMLQSVQQKEEDSSYGRK